MSKYKIVRFYFRGTHKSRVIVKGLTLEEVQDHCSNTETSSSTCKTEIMKKYTEKMGPWFDGYVEDN